VTRQQGLRLCLTNQTHDGRHRDHEQEHTYSSNHDFSFIVCGTWKLQFQLSNAAEIRLLRRAGVSALPESPVDFKSDHYFTPISTPCEYEKEE
jgi:hypothetical protein